MAGLFAGLLLRRAGWDVQIFERSGAEISGRGAGIVTHDELFEILGRCGVDTKAAQVGVFVAGRRVFEQDGRLSAELPLPQVVTSWGHLHHLLRSVFPVEHYHCERNLKRVDDHGDRVVAHFEDGSSAEGDLLIGADGIFSTVRSIFAPEVMPSYVGYVAWRGLVAERDLPQEIRDEVCDYFAFSLPAGEQMLGYPVAGENEAMERGKRRYNFVWYRPAPADGALRDLLTDRDGVQHALSVPPNKIRPELIAALRETATQTLAPQFAQIVATTPQPFIQVIQDLASPKMIMAPRTVIIGDAAFVARPHVGMGVTKAAADAAALVDALTQRPDDITAALNDFATQRQAFGEAVVRRARQLGSYMQSQLLTEEDRMYAERHRKPDAVMAETAVATFVPD